MGYQKFGSNPTLRKSGLLPSNPVRACSSISILDAQFAAMLHVRQLLLCDRRRRPDIPHWRVPLSALDRFDFPHDLLAKRSGVGVPVEIQGGQNDGIFESADVVA